MADIFPRRTLSVGKAIVIGTLIVGTLDALDAILVFGLRSGVTPPRIFRGIAGGVLGSAAGSGGTPVALLGVLLHYTVALGIVNDLRAREPRSAGAVAESLGRRWLAFERSAEYLDASRFRFE